MKHLISLFISFVLCISLTKADVRLVISDGLDNPALVAKMEQKASALFTEINEAQSAKRTPRLGALHLNESVQGSIQMLWENCPFYISDQKIVEKCVITKEGYQIRNIPLLMTPADPEKYIDDEFQGGVINFSRQGEIESFHLSLKTNLYTDIIKANKDVKDLRRRQLILDYVEQFRTAYNTKDTAFLEAIFSDDALIIVGRVVTERRKGGDFVPQKITYKKYNKKQYLDNVKIGFHNKAWIRVVFDKIEVKRHPNPKYQDFYGVTLHQSYKSSNYSDEGYVFLLWDFRDESKPQIHVRTWQPDKFDDGTALPKEEIITLGDFSQSFDNNGSNSIQKDK